MPEQTVLRGAAHRADEPICTVVMSYMAQRTTKEAVLSLLRQDAACEIVVVNSGGPSLRPVLGPLLEHILLVESPIRLLPGGARNLGIRHSTAPIVAFLAADCLAGKGWVSNRLALHGAGHIAVASALLPAARNGTVTPAAMASYWAIHWRRMPETPADDASRHGASYMRSVFDRLGPFRDDLRVSEDSHFNSTLENGGDVLLWAPAVVTHHRYPDTVMAALLDQTQRGRRMACYHRRELKRQTHQMARRGLAMNRAILPSVAMWLGPEKMQRHATAARLLPHLLRARTIGGAVGLVTRPVGRSR